MLSNGFGKILEIEKREYMNQEIDKWLPYLYWLDSIPEMGRKINNRLLEVYSSPISIYNIEETELRNWLNEKQFYHFRKAQLKNHGEIIRSYESLVCKKIRFLPHMHKDFPQKLKQIADRPFAIYVKGSLPASHLPSVAMIGTRKCSEYGSYIAQHFAKVFAEHGCQIISGMASGIDGISQRTALQYGTTTYAILGSGVDICYPKGNLDIFQQIPQQGGIISEYCPGTPAMAGQFPPRNRIISALSDVVLVVEAQEKSGTLITVDMALEQGKEVYAIPGRCTDVMSVGCNRLLKQGAGVATDPKDILKEVFHMDVLSEKGKKETRKKTKVNALSPIGNHIYEIMQPESETVDEIYYRFLEKYPQKVCSITDLMCELMDLQMKGYVESVGGKYHKTV